jgi:hypothetical protein
MLGVVVVAKMNSRFTRFTLGIFSYCLTILLFGYYCHAQEQTKKKYNDFLGTWHDGKVNLPDTSFICLVRYNDLEGVLMYKFHSNQSDIKSLRASDVTGFNYLDTTQTQRIFISIPYDVQENGTMVPSFFEVLKEYKRFALLSVKLPLQGITKVNPIPSKYNSGPHRSVQQREVICIFDDNGNLRPYLEITSQEAQGSRKIKSQEQIINADLLREYLGNDFNQLEEFSFKNNLSFKKKEGLLTIFDYYDKIQME